MVLMREGIIAQHLMSISLKDVIERWQNSGESRTELKDMMVESFELSEREAEEILTELWR